MKTEPGTAAANEQLAILMLRDSILQNCANCSNTLRAKFGQLVQLLWTYLTEWTQVSLGICNTLGKNYAPIAQMLMRC